VEIVCFTAGFLLGLIHGAWWTWLLMTPKQPKAKPEQAEVLEATVWECDEEEDDYIDTEDTEDGWKRGIRPDGSRVDE